MMGEFSRRGEACTAFERALVSAADARSESLAVWLGLIGRVGLDAILALFDELGSEKVHVPTREHFFSALFRVQRDDEIRRRLAAGESVAVVAADFHLSLRSVYGIRNCEDADARANVVKGRA